jgi:signal transduction histidine kinase
MAPTLKDAFSVTRFSFWTGALLSSLIGSLLYLATVRSIESDARERFINHARYAQSVIDVRVQSYSNLLRSAASLIQSADPVTRRQFHDYVQGLDLPRHFPAVGFFNYAVPVAGAQRDAFVASMDTELKTLLGPKASFKIFPPGKRPYYFLTVYMEPELQRADLYGLDLNANPYFGDLLMKERDDGTMHTTGTPVPSLSKPNHIYLGLRLPVYRNSTALDTVEQRRAAYVGSLGLAFSLRILLHGVLEDIPIAGVRMTLTDTGTVFDSHRHKTAQKAFTLFDSLGTTANPRPTLASGDDVFSITLPLDFNGRPWHIVYSVPKANLYTEFDVYYPKLMMAFGFLGSILLYALLHTLASSRRAALSLAQEMTRELRESQGRLQLSHQKLRRLADHAYQIKELERKRIAREIHDDLGQNLLALRIEAELLATRTEGSHSHLNKRARATLLQIDATIRSVRQIINDLRPTVLDLGLSAAVEWQVTQFQRRTGIQCEVIDEHGEITLPDHCATAFFRILQESLTNIVRHANATRVTVELRLNGGWLSLNVRDNGRGLGPGGRNKYGSFGLVGIEERIVILGGTYAVFSEASGGTTIMVSAPVVGIAELPLRQPHEHGSGSAVI